MAETETGPPAPEAAAPVPEPPVVAATWQEHEPAEPWCPAALAAAVPWAASLDTAHHRAWRDEADAHWHCLAGTRRGRAHAHQAQWREDAARVARLATPHGPATLLVAADGAGSARWSRVGAEAACHAVEDHLADALTAGAAPGPALVAAVQHAVRTLRELAIAGAGAPRDLRTTLLAALLVGDTLSTTQVGDGAILVQEAGGAVRQVGAGDSGEFSGEVTCFVPDEEAETRAAAALVEQDARGLTRVVLATDGIEDPFYPLARKGALLLAQLEGGVEAPAEHFQRQAAHGPVLGHPEATARLAQWLAFERRGENDDRTIVVAHRPRGA
jgi:serine/threonine protein phosphatase PrpC